MFRSSLLSVLVFTLATILATDLILLVARSGAETVLLD
jgi:hypothetical protein